MDAGKKIRDLDEIVQAVARLLDELISRRGRDKAVSKLKVAIALYVRIAYLLGSEHTMHDLIDGSAHSPGNGHSKESDIK
jgi:hypothetical protein